VIVPLIWKPWMVQWYGNVPALLNANVNMSPGDRNPESKTPVSEVAVCVVCPSFVQQTVVPAGIVTLAGL
jgi:hypothetical protein